MRCFSTLCLGLSAITLSQAAAFNKRAALDDCLQSSSAPSDVLGSDDWKLDVAPFNTRVNFTPVAIAVPTKIEHVQSAIACAVKLGIKVTPKCGGHSYASLGLGGEDGHLVLELDRMSNVSLNTETNVATIQAGARLGHVASELFNQGKRDFSHGTCPGVGVSGHALHGGYGMSSHTHGLATDWIKSATIVLANSSIITASASSNADLFWALRGAGSNFGVVVSYEFNTFAVPANVTWFAASLPWNKSNAVANLEALEEYVNTTMPAELNMRVFASGFLTQLEGQFFGDVAGLKSALAPLFNKTGGTIQQAQTVGWLEALAHYGNMKLDQTHPYSMQETFYSKSLELPSLHGATASAFVDYWFTTAKNITTSRMWYFQIDLHGGAHSAVTNGDFSLSSYAHRDKLYLIEFYDRVSRPPYPADGHTFLDGWVSAVTDTLKEDEWGMYINYADTSLDRETAQRVYWGKGLERLRGVKERFDPDEVFYYPQSVNPKTGAGTK
ncbi:uncharacterized protein BCR38DRAFT_491769 [Pseudomassariella vexata]|uniref:FAD-binding PCMH-type domain-containing protein n=1 Tax=Pseudomassariella vexata TaxID=1141098 RepID=A0A1Y2EHB5_9PEZI|nr:uncharacterized protein BCR38DRAFT_491769 [Pseudomassariella vexata]ORY70959.1 hypothetical protein BCR38DRAFT_491769 [Pseudomassariella vexata]